MKPSFALLALVPFLASLRGDELTFAVKKGTSIEKTFEFELALDKDSMSMTLDGEELPANHTADFEMSISESKKVVVLDEYGELGAGRPKELTRSFKEVHESKSQHVAASGKSAQDDDKDHDSDLVGHTVTFKWNADEKRYDVAWQGDGADDAYLEKLEEDMDMRALLPEKAVDVDDSWEVSAKDAGHALLPGGKLGFSSDESKKDDNFEFDKLFSDPAKLTYKGQRDVDGATVALIELELEGQSTQEMGSETPMPMTADISLEMKSEVLWLVAEHRPLSAHTDAKMTMNLHNERELDMKGKKSTFRTEINLSGKLTIEATYEVQ